MSERHGVTVGGLPRGATPVEARTGSYPARWWTSLPDAAVRCGLSPRGCVIADGAAGFCGVRVNDGGQLRAVSYGRSVSLRDEPIEAAGIHHFAPGTRTLSLGHRGSAVDCERCFPPYTPAPTASVTEPAVPVTAEQVVEEALARGIHTICWTHRDPVVWQEFVLDTAALAREYGILNVHVSGLHISRAALTELADVIEVFSVLQRPDPPGSERLTQVLDGAEYVFRRGRHIEVTHLTDITSGQAPDTLETVATRLVTTLSPDVPLHLRPLPDSDVAANPELVTGFEALRERARAVGVRHCYLVGVPGHAAADSHCLSCGAVVVERPGGSSHAPRLTPAGACLACGRPQPFRLVTAAMPAPDGNRPPRRDQPPAACHQPAPAAPAPDVPPRS